MTRILRVGGAVLLSAMLALAGWSLYLQSAVAAPPGTARYPDLVGLLEIYDDNAFSVITVTDGLQRVAVAPDTTVNVGTTPGTFGDLRPGSLIAVWQRPGGGCREDPPIAASIVVYPPR